MKLAICGDSFCFPDPEYGLNWCDLLEQKHPKIDIVNYSSPGASNYLISLQVRTALEQGCDRIIYHATSSIRQEFSLKEIGATRDSVDRYWNPTSTSNKSVLCNSWINPQKNSLDTLSTRDHSVIKEFFSNFVDLPSMIEKNYIFIRYTLSLLASSSLASWAWSRGGFEHSSFGKVSEWQFDDYAHNHCALNLWDYYDPSLPRPYYHVTQPEVHQQACEIYSSMLNLSNDTNT